MDKIIGIITCNYRIDNPEAFGRSYPLAALPFAGRYHLIDFPLSNMVNSGIRTVGIILPSMIRPVLNHLGSGKEWNLDRKTGGLFILQGTDPGIYPRNHDFVLRDLQKNIDFLENSIAEYVILSNCSNIVNVDFKEAVRQHRQTEADITLLVKEMILTPEDEQVLIVEADRRGRAQKLVKAQGKTGQKGLRFSNMLIMKRNLLLDIIRGYQEIEYINIMDALEKYVSILKIGTFRIPGYIGRIYSRQSFFQRSMEMLQPEIQKELFLGERRILTRSRDCPPTKYGPASAVQNALVSSGCIIEGNVSESIVFRGVAIEEAAKVTNCIIMKSCIIGRGTVLENVIVPNHTIIQPGIFVRGQPDDVMMLNINQTVSTGG